jgi:SAM-dependent methyltransferase
VSGVHRAAAEGFQNAADAYERGRPGYPRSAVDHLLAVLALRTSDVVVDVGAGTGKLTRELVRTRAHVVAVEPVSAMRSVLAAAAPAAEIVDGTAEDLPLADSSVDAIAVAQAFHWFDGDAALEEFARVLRPGGALALVWNVRDEAVPWCARLTRLLDARAGDAPRYRDGRWRAAFERATTFEPLALRSFPHVQPLSRAAFLDRIGSISFVAAADPAERETIFAEVDDLLRTDPDLSGIAQIPFPYRTDVLTTRRR